MAFGNGVNLQPSYAATREIDFAWSLMKKNRKIRTVRIEIEPDKVNAAAGWIQQACGQGYEVIATYHSHVYQEQKSSVELDNPAALMAAAEWWKSNYAKLCSKPAEYQVQAGDTLTAIAQKFYGQVNKASVLLHENRHIKNRNLIFPGDVLRIPAIGRRFTINIMNEWGSHELTAQQYVEFYNRAIGIVRGAHHDLPLIVDLPGSGQETHVAACAVNGVGTNGVKLNVHNISLSTHIYKKSWVGQRGSGVKGPPARADLDELAATSVPCIVGEFGSNPLSQDVKQPAQWDVLVHHATTLGWPVLGWAWNGDGEGMNMVLPPWWGLLPIKGFDTFTSPYNKTIDDLL